jgi:hypothetical protein
VLGHSQVLVHSRALVHIVMYCPTGQATCFVERHVHNGRENFESFSWGYCKDRLRVSDVMLS